MHKRLRKRLKRHSGDIMQAVIVAAGKSTRTFPLTLTRPKPLLKVANKTLLEHNLDQLEGLVDEVIIVVGYMKEQIMKQFGMRYGKLKLTYVIQKEQLGTGHALQQVEQFIKDKFIYLQADDLHDKEEFKQCLKHSNSILAKKIDDVSTFGALRIKNKKLVEIIEKPDKAAPGFANTACYVLEKYFFKYLNKIKKSKRGELELTDALNMFAKEHDVHVIESKLWITVAFPWDMLDANAYLLSKIKAKNEGKIGENVTINGEVIIGKGTVIKAGSFIEGPAIIGKNCEIGPMTHIRPDTAIDDNCRIGKTEVVDCVIMANTTSKHHAYLGHSVIGENVNIGAGTITADYRHDAKNHITIVNGKKVNTGRRKLGAFIGDKVKTAIHTTIYPGRKIWPNLGTLPGEILTKDKVE